MNKKIYITRKVEYRDEIEITAGSSVEIDSLLYNIEEQINDNMLNGSLNDIIGELEENGCNVSGICRDGSPQVEVEFDIIDF